MRTHNLEFVVNGETHKFDTSKELLIDRDDLDTELSRQAAHYAWFAVLHERARAERVHLESDLDERDASLYLKLKIKTAEDKPKPTEAALKQMVAADQSRSASVSEIQAAEETERTLGAIVYAIAQRKDMIVSLARARGFEMATPSAEFMDRIRANLGAGRKD